MIDRFKTKISKIFEAEEKFRYQLLIEKELARAHFQQQHISKEAWEDIELHCTQEFVKLERVQEIEKQIHHDLMAVVLAITEQCTGEGAKFVHLGATSSDIQDTVLGLQLNQAKSILEISLQGVIKELERLTKAHRDVLCIGRTHGQHALPMTMGFKFANFLNEFLLSKDQFLSSKVGYGKLSGAIGTYASFNSDKTEKIVMTRLGLEWQTITTQIIPRVVFLPFLSSLLSISCSAERLAKEIRNLQRPEIGELFEEFTDQQVGSSTMPHKRNPHKSERICGLVRIIRNLFTAQVETIAVEHERDLTNSAPERITFLEIVTLVDYILLELQGILSRIQIDKKNIQKNLYLSGGRNLTEAVMLKVAPVLGRQKAHELLNRLTNHENFIDALKSNETIKNILNEAEINTLLQPENYLGQLHQCIDEVLLKV